MGRKSKKGKANPPQSAYDTGVDTSANSEMRSAEISEQYTSIVVGTDDAAISTPASVHVDRRATDSESMKASTVKSGKSGATSEKHGGSGTQSHVLGTVEVNSSKATLQEKGAKRRKVRFYLLLFKVLTVLLCIACLGFTFGSNSVSNTRPNNYVAGQIPMAVIASVATSGYKRQTIGINVILVLLWAGMCAVSILVVECAFKTVKGYGGWCAMFTAGVSCGIAVGALELLSVFMEILWLASFD
ncbi:hypothetical protein AX774_g5132 [Zancudomyces culisetae]|uniref:Uncharacterized protein n=1 Tax=Zancudomyces culisetae TaxID=1213189 RepID=A0A1R1PKE3_ZANCU|nr:hypothetical protein AX774_g5132 [Zancudomyces culisetae]|eukprot:OMH81409.1 hypothetical protein AX774_g5132 [Zancudomyces culisetae]